MEYITLTGRRRKVHYKDYLIDWDRKVSGPQKKIKDFLRPYWQHDIVCEEWTIPASRMRVDLYSVSRGIMIEVSPNQHHQYNPFFHGSLAGYRASIKRDLEKARFAAINGLIFVEVTPADPVTVEWFATQGVIL